MAIRWTAAAGLLILAGWPAPAAVAQTALTLDALERMALAGHPAVARAAAAVAAADARTKQAGRWPNPMIGYTAEEVSGGPTIRWGEHGVFVEQVFPISGRLGADRAVRAREADEARAAEDVERRRVLSTVRLLYREALLAARRVSIREDLAAHGEEAAATARQLANIGAVDRPDVLAAEIDALAARTAVDAARHEARRIRRRLAQAVGDTSVESAPLAGDPDAAPGPVDRAAALAALRRDSPDARAAEARVVRAEAALARAKKEPRPDLVVRAGPRYNRELLDPGPAPVGWEAFADVGVTVPLWDRNRAGVAAAEADVARARAGAAQVELDLRSRLTDLFRRHAAAADRLRTYRDEIAPRAEEAHRLVRDRYDERAAEYADVLAARRRALAVREESLDALQRLWRAALLIDGLLLGGGGD